MTSFLEEFREFNAYVRNTGGEVEDTFAGDLRQRIIKAADRNTEHRRAGAAESA